VETQALIGPIRFYFKVIAVALSHSLERADLLGGILAVLGGALTYVYPQLANAVGLGLWAIPLSFFLILFLVRLMLAPFWVLRDEQETRAETQTKLDSLLAPRPLILFVKARKSPTFRPSRVVAAKVPAGELIQAWFENRPALPSDGSVARQIGAIVSFRSPETDNPLFQVHGQWAKSTAPNHVGFKGTTPTLDLNPGALCAKLIIALKYPSDSDAFAYSAESLQNHIDGRNPGLRLPPGEYDVTVEIRGVNVDQQFALRLSNSGDETGLALSQDPRASQP